MKLKIKSTFSKDNHRGMARGLPYLGLTNPPKAPPTNPNKPK